jgi:hypothetical protein
MADQDETLPQKVAQPITPKSDHHLTVVHPFGTYRRGDAITDDAEIAAVLAGENAHHCRRVFPK